MGRTRNKRGWNFRKGQKDCATLEELRKRGSNGGKRSVSKGFSSREVLEKALKTRGIKLKDED